MSIPSPTPIAPRIDRIATNRWTVFAILLLVAVAARAVQYGNPVVQMDDEFYLLVGDRMWHGVVPYVDIWDRKPVGLFVLYWAIRALPGDGVLAYQLVATLFAAATAFVIGRIARRFAGALAALLAGIVYLLYLDVFGGDGGQSPVFYNLLVGLAALCVMRAIEREAFDRRASTWVAAATLLMGVAMQIKYTALFEGAYFGLAMLWRLQRGGAGPVRLIADAALWLALALLPTAVAWAVYARMGDGDAFIFANFISIFTRNGEPFVVLLGRFAGTLGLLVPLIVAMALAGWPRRNATDGYHADAMAERRFTIGWAIAAAAGYIVFGGYFDHYTLPLLVPLTIGAAPAFGRAGAMLAILWRGRRYGMPYVAFVMIFVIGFAVDAISHDHRNRGTGPEVREMAAYVAPRLTNCLFVYDGEPSLYRLTGSCFPSRYAFPAHLNNVREDGAIGIDTLTETRRIMAGQPSVVVASQRVLGKANLRTLAFMRAELRRHYRLGRTWKIGSNEREIYLRQPGGSEPIDPHPHSATYINVSNIGKPR